MNSDLFLRYVCSCCSAIIDASTRKLLDNNNSEGNLCLECYQEQFVQNSIEYLEIFSKIELALNPINSIKWKYLSFTEKYRIYLRMLEDKIIIYNIS